MKTKQSNENKDLYSIELTFQDQTYTFPVNTETKPKLRQISLTELFSQNRDERLWLGTITGPMTIKLWYECGNTFTPLQQCHMSSGSHALYLSNGYIDVVRVNS